MALATFSDLKTAIASWLNRSDLTATIPDFITLAEAQLNRRLRVREMTGRSTAAVSTEFYAIPTDFRGPRTAELVTDPITPLDYVSPDVAMKLKASAYQASGKPLVYTVIGDEFQFLPAPDQEYTVRMSYWKNVPALSDSNTSNWLLAAHPDVYLYASLLQSAPYLKNDGRLVTWGSIFEAILTDMHKDDATASYGGNLKMVAGSYG